jgi:tetratricopeptide (TPR) repeat protein
MRQRLFFLPCLFLAGIFLLLTLPVSGQALPYSIDEGATLLRQYKISHSDTGRVQLLLKLSSFYLLKPGEDKKDMDTALLLARQAGTLSRQLQYASGTDNALYWEGRIHIEDTAFNAVYPLLQQVSDTTRIKLLLEMYDYQLCNPPRNPSRPGYFDSAFRNAQQAMALSQSAGLVDWQLRCRIRYANQQMQLDQYAQARAIFQQVFDSSLQRRSLQGLQEDHYWIRAWSGSDTALSGLLVQCSKKLMAVYPNLHDTAFKGPVHQLIFTWIIGEGNQFIGRKQLQRAAESMERLFQFGRTYPLARFDNYSSLIIIYNALKQYDKTFHYIFAAMHLLEASGNPDHEDGPYWNAAMLYVYSGNDSLGLQYYRQAILLARQKGIVPAIALCRYAQLLLRLKRPAEALHLLLDNTQPGERNNLYDFRDRKLIAEGLGDCYYALGQYPQAERHYLEAATLSESLHLVSETLNAWYLVGRFYTNTGQYEKARPFLEKIAANKDIVQLPVDLMARTERFLFRIDSAAGNYLAAIRHQNRFEVLNDSLL